MEALPWFEDISRTCEDFSTARVIDQEHESTNEIYKFLKFMDSEFVYHLTRCKHFGASGEPSDIVREYFAKSMFNDDWFFFYFAIDTPESWYHAWVSKVQYGY